MAALHVTLTKESRCRHCLAALPHLHTTPPAVSTPHAMYTRRRCCPTAWCWLQGDLIAVAFLPARNCTIRRAGPGPLPPASTPHAMSTRRPCCPTARCWLQGDLIAAFILPPPH